MKKKVFIIAIIICVATSVFAQGRDMTEEQMASFKDRCVEYIEALQYGLEIIGDKHQPKEVKTHYKKNVLDFFMGRGEPYQIKDSNGHSKMQPSVRMFVSKLGSDTPKPMPMKDYLTHLETLPYAVVKITKAATCKISNFYPVPGSPDKYTATATFFQYFEGKNREGVTIYKDHTQKDVTIFISKVVDGNLGEFWDIKFGDINVAETSE